MNESIHTRSWPMSAKLWIAALVLLNIAMAVTPKDPETKTVHVAGTYAPTSIPRNIDSQSTRSPGMTTSQSSSTTPSRLRATQVGTTTPSASVPRLTTAPTPAPTQPRPLPPTTLAHVVPPTQPHPQPPSTAPQVAPPTTVYFKNCDAARAAGVAPLHTGDPGYRAGLDRDHDGVACE